MSHLVWINAVLQFQLFPVFLHVKCERVNLTLFVIHICFESVS